MNYYNGYQDLRLDELGIASDEEAAELEFELELRFEDFTPKDRRIWLKQNAYLEHFSRTGTIDSAAREAGVTIYTAQRWEYDNVLGFTRRLEVSTLTFKDRLQQKALLRASDPDAPVTPLIELLRRMRENSHREKEAGHPFLQRIKQGDPDPFPLHRPGTTRTPRPSAPSTVSPPRPTGKVRPTGEVPPPGERHSEGVPPAPSDANNSANKERPKRKTLSP